MSRMVEIEKRLSMLMEKHLHIVYFVTEDRDILKQVFSEMSDTVKAFLQGSAEGTIGKMLQTASPDVLYRVAATNGILVDAYEVFHLKEHSYITEGCFHTADGRREEKQPWQACPVFFLLNDFHIIRESAAAHFLKQFLAASKKEEDEYRRFTLLFLVSPLLKLPEGFGSEVEVIDVPEMDEEDIREYLLYEAVKEYTGGGLGTKGCKENELDPIDTKRIWESARDFRGIPQRGLQEITADLQAEYGSFFGRVKDQTGIEKNLLQITRARKEKVVEFKREEARHDSTVTMKEPDNAVAGQAGFLRWIEDIREEFLDMEKASRFGNEPPKGVLLTGVPGSGKTQAAKKVAAMMGGLEGNVPLVQFRMDNLLGSLVGDSEANFKRCRKRIEALAPCIVLIDEIEKTFHTDDKNGNHDVKMNIFSALLDWMQENKKQIFFFATSNSVANLKPELLRDGRFDMRFCIFMPTHEELAAIFSLHMKESQKRAGGQLFEAFDYEELAGDFLDEITQYAKEQQKYMFYTGANIVNLITQANRGLKKEMEKERRAGRILRNAYYNKLLEVAKGAYSQPYGMTNMQDIVKFWCSAFKNKYTNAGAVDLFPFAAFDEERGVFRKEGLEEPDREYDKYMFCCISAEIEKYCRHKN